MAFETETIGSEKPDQKTELANSEVCNEFRKLLEKKKIKNFSQAREPLWITAKVPEWVKRVSPSNTSQKIKKSIYKNGQEKEESDEDMEEAQEASDQAFIENFANKWIKTEQVNNITILRAKICWRYYAEIGDFLEDVNSLTKFVLKRCENTVKKIFLLYSLQKDI